MAGMADAVGVEKVEAGARAMEAGERALAVAAAVVVMVATACRPHCHSSVGCKQVFR